MKRVLCVICAIVALCTCAGCQKTPESPIVVGKNNEKLLAAAHGPGDSTIAQQVDAPRHVATGFTDSTGRLVFSVDAQVALPDADAARIIRVTSHEVTQAEVDVWTNALFEGETLYSPGSFDVMTRDYLEGEILKLKKRLAEMGEEAEGRVIGHEVAAAPDEDGEDAVQADEPSAMTEGDQLRNVIAHYEEMLKTAPDAPVPEETTNRLEASENNREVSAVSFAVPNGTGITAFFAGNYEYAHPIVYSNRGDSTFIVMMESLIFPIADMELDYMSAGDAYRARFDEYRAMREPEISAQEAQELGDAFLEKLGMEGYVLKRADMSISEPRIESVLGEPQGNVLKGWRLEYTREIDGVPVSYSDVEQASPAEGEPWSYERVMLFVTDDGVAEAYIPEQYDVGETLVESCKLMDFGSVMEIFEKMAPIEYNVTALGDVVRAEWRVSAIELGYARIAEENASFSGLLVPAWSFYGTQEVVYDRDGYTVTASLCPIMTINAVDGSVINRYAGY